MFSINIPVYNVFVSDLVLQLKEQAEAAEIDFEIRIYDDCSGTSFKNENRKLSDLPGIIYREMVENLGRAAIRNKMGFDSAKKYLLFIDADSKLISGNFLKAYIENVKPGKVLCGGTAYSDKDPGPEKRLRWIYGQKREAISADKRNKQKGFIITSNNFLIENEIFRKIHFRENIGKYGHEDTLLGYDLFKAGILPEHIDNPVEHSGIEDSALFLQKTRTALKNLYFISEKIVPEAEFRNQIPFLKRYYSFTRFIPESLLRFFFWLTKSLAEKNLTGKKPNLRYFDFYKAGYFSTLKK